MLLSKLNSVGAIFISCLEAADVIRRIARRESVAKGREGLPSYFNRSSRQPCPSSFLSSVALLARLSVYVCALSTISLYSNRTLHTVSLPDVYSLVLAVGNIFLRLPSPLANVALRINPRRLKISWMIRVRNTRDNSKLCKHEHEERVEVTVPKIAS